MNTKQIIDAMKNRYRQPDWSLFFEVANGTGGNINRYADAVAMNMFPSRGLEIMGEPRFFEVQFGWYIGLWILSIQGYCVKVAYGADMAIKMINEYMGIK